MKEKKLDRGLLHFRKQREVEKLYSSPLFQIGNIPEAIRVLAPSAFFFRRFRRPLLPYPLPFSPETRNWVPVAT